MADRVREGDSADGKVWIDDDPEFARPWRSINGVEKEAAFGNVSLLSAKGQVAGVSSVGSPGLSIAGRYRIQGLALCAFFLR